MRMRKEREKSASHPKFPPSHRYVAGIAYLCKIESRADDRSRNHSPDICRRQYRRYRRRVCYAQTPGRQLSGMLSVSSGEDTVVRSLARTRHLQVLRLRQGRQRRQLHHGVRERHLSRSVEDGGQALRHRGAREGDERRGRAAQQQPREHVRRQYLGLGLFRRSSSQQRGGAQRRAELPVAKPRFYRRYDPQVRSWLLPLEGRCHVACGARGGLQGGVPPVDGTLDQERARRFVVRPVPRPRDVPRAQRLGARGGLRRPHAAHRQESSKISKLARERDIQQEPRAVRSLLRQEGHTARGLRHNGRGLCRRDIDAPGWRGECRGLVRNVAHDRPDTSAGTLHEEHHGHVRRRCRGRACRHKGRGHDPARGHERQDSAPAARARPRHLCARQHDGLSAQLCTRQCRGLHLVQGQAAAAGGDQAQPLERQEP